MSFSINKGSGSSFTESAMLFFYWSPEWTNQTVAQERAFCIFCKFGSHNGFSDTLARERWAEEFSQVQYATSPLDATKSNKLDFNRIFQKTQKSTKKLGPTLKMQCYGNAKYLKSKKRSSPLLGSVSFIYTFAVCLGCVHKATCIFSPIKNFVSLEKVEELDYPPGRGVAQHSPAHIISDLSEWKLYFKCDTCSSFRWTCVHKMCNLTWGMEVRIDLLSVLNHCRIKDTDGKPHLSARGAADYYSLNHSCRSWPSQVSSQTMIAASW